MESKGEFGRAAGKAGGLRFAGPLQKRRVVLRDAEDVLNKAKVIYGETSGVYPQLKPDGKTVYDPRNWDASSYEKLLEARRKIAIVSERNSNTHSQRPNLQNPIEKRVWEKCRDAAGSATAEELPSGVRYFFLRQEGQGPQAPSEKQLKNVVLHESFGPFRNVGGGDVKKGNKLFIDFYRGPK